MALAHLLLPEWDYATGGQNLPAPAGREPTIAQVIEATGWGSSTRVGGFLAGLQRQGSTLEVLQRARQVGAGKACARVSYSIYRLVEEI
jgi:fructose-1-phosphate kinase PfkB-like protein